MELTVNNQIYQIEMNPDLPLLWALRNELNLTGTRYGCGSGYCGSCTVHLDGVATRSCITLLRDVAGREVRTVEDLASADNDGNQTLHPIQQAFIDEQVPQCSWCMSGQMMTAVSLLEENPNPTEAEIVEGMSNNYCRCGCYYRIKTAVADAASRLAEKETEAA